MVGKSTMRPASFRNHTLHMHVPLDQQKHQCKYGCGYGHPSPGTMGLHEQFHENNEFPCPEEGCGSILGSMQTLNGRLRKIHTENGLTIHERRFAEFLDGTEFNYIHELRVNFACLTPGTSYCRIDFCIVERGIVFLLELDEDHHKSDPVSCESRRPIKVPSMVAADGNTLPIAFIQLNADNYQTGHRSGKVALKDRYEAVMRLIREWRPTAKLIEVQYCFYYMDGDGELKVATPASSRSKAQKVWSSVILGLRNPMLCHDRRSSSTSLRRWRRFGVRKS